MRFVVFEVIGGVWEKMRLIWEMSEWRDGVRWMVELLNEDSI